MKPIHHRLCFRISLYLINKLLVKPLHRQPIGIEEHIDQYLKRPLPTSSWIVPFLLLRIHWRYHLPLGLSNFRMWVGSKNRRRRHKFRFLSHILNGIIGVRNKEVAGQMRIKKKWRSIFNKKVPFTLCKSIF